MTFDIGEDTGTPVLEEYEAKMPFRFTGTLDKLVVVLDPLKLSEEEQARLRGELAKAMMPFNDEPVGAFATLQRIAWKGVEALSGIVHRTQTS